MALIKAALVLALVVVANATICPWIYNYEKIRDLNAISGRWYPHFLPNNGNSSGFTGDCITYYALNEPDNQINAQFCGPRADNPKRVECSPILGSGVILTTNIPGHLKYRSNGIEYDARVTLLDEKRGWLMGTACTVINKKVYFGGFGFTRSQQDDREFRTAWWASTLRNGAPVQNSVRINQRDDCPRALAC